MSGSIDVEEDLAGKGGTERLSLHFRRIDRSLCLLIYILGLQPSVRDPPD